VSTAPDIDFISTGKVVETAWKLFTKRGSVSELSHMKQDVNRSGRVPPTCLAPVGF
jgi:hypothetical protein